MNVEVREVLGLFTVVNLDALITHQTMKPRASSATTPHGGDGATKHSFS